MEMRAYLRACQLMAEKREQERRKRMDKVMSVVIIALFWTVMIAVYMIK